MRKETYEYLEHYIENLENKNDTPKVRFFLMCLKENFGDGIFDSLAVFGKLDKNDLLKCFERYVVESPSKQAAGDFRRTMLALCEKICVDYRLENDFLKNAKEINDFNETVKVWIELLEEPQSRECMSSADYKILDTEIQALFDTYNLEDKINDSITIKNYKPNYYGRLVSAIALKLIQKFGLDNKVVPNLKISDLNMQDRIINVNGFQLPMNEEIVSCMKLYLKYREQIVNEDLTDILFIKKNGTPYTDKNGKPDSGQLFLLMDKALGHTTTTGLRYKTIINLVSKGANINLLSGLTGVKKETIAEICIEEKENLEDLFRDTDNANTRIQKLGKKGLIRCPFCGNYEDAISENWILIQVAGEDTKHIACRKCRGLDGKYRY